MELKRYEGKIPRKRREALWKYMREYAALEMFLHIEEDQKKDRAVRWYNSILRDHKSFEDFRKKENELFEGNPMNAVQMLDDIYKYAIYAIDIEYTNLVKAYHNAFDYVKPRIHLIDKKDYPMLNQAIVRYYNTIDGIITEENAKVLFEHMNGDADEWRSLDEIRSLAQRNDFAKVYLSWRLQRIAKQGLKEADLASLASIRDIAADMDFDLLELVKDND